MIIKMNPEASTQLIQILEKTISPGMFALVFNIVILFSG